ncbi:hypothetical protein GW721_09465 [Citrobacter braakii]|jgi:type 1 fimbria pilin|nr:hypothetical protein [Citrobacter braakii]
MKTSLKKTIFAVVIGSVFTTSCLAATTPIVGNTGTLTISGQLKVATCSVDLDKTTFNFGNVEANVVKTTNPNSFIKGAAQKVNFTFGDCPAGTIKFGLTANKLVAGSANKGALTIAGKDTTTIYYRTYTLDNSKLLDLNGNVTSAANLVAVTGANTADKVVPLNIELVRGSGPLSGLTGPLAGTINYTLAYQ